MILGIDAANIRAGGGLTHLVELLAAADPSTHGFTRVIVWCGGQTAALLPARPWLEVRHVPMLDRALPFRTVWQVTQLTRAVRAAECDMLFSPGGSYTGRFRPMVTFNQNLLPFDWAELRRFGWSPMTLKMLLLARTQARTFRQADGVIFLTEHARAFINTTLGALPGKAAVVPHGLDPRFGAAPRPQRAMSECSPERPFRLLYVSALLPYKHQAVVADAVMRLRRQGRAVTLDLVGPGSPGEVAKLSAVLRRLDPAGTTIRYLGPVDYAQLHRHYAAAEAFIFASSCESFGQILTEAMSAGLPIACSRRSAMPELLGEAGVYFDPEDAADIEATLAALLDDPDRRAAVASAAFREAAGYSWTRCAAETFAFLATVARDHHRVDGHA